MKQEIHLNHIRHKLYIELDCCSKLGSESLQDTIYAVLEQCEDIFCNRTEFKFVDSSLCDCCELDEHD